MAKLVFLLLVAATASGCTVKSSVARAPSYDFSEYETYDQPHAQPVSWSHSSSPRIAAQLPVPQTAE